MIDDAAVALDRRAPLYQIEKIDPDIESINNQNFQRRHQQQRNDESVRQLQKVIEDQKKLIAQIQKESFQEQQQLKDQISKLQTSKEERLFKSFSLPTKELAYYGMPHNIGRQQSCLSPPMAPLFQEQPMIKYETENPFHKMPCFGQWTVTEPSKHFYFECPKVRHLSKMPQNSEIKLKTIGFKQNRVDGPFLGLNMELTNGFKSINYEWDRDSLHYKRIADLSKVSIRKVGIKVYSPNNWHL